MGGGDFEGLAALVTGAGSGIGLATARVLAEREARVAAFDLDPSAAGPLLGIQGDVTDDRLVGAAVAEVVERFGRLDVLVNNAGIAAVGRVAVDGGRAGLRVRPPTPDAEVRA